ncbi:hypothetical protein KY342_04420 [Candidatus Woesearchaeota archaeon]|nr:hypothetical protein [Candidatus Woesearchaeota archaeon]
MKKIILFFILILISGCGIQGMTVIEPSLTLTTDKEVYHSGEIIHITSIINSPIEANASIKFYGIHASRYRLDQTFPINLNKGKNTVTVDYTSPRCNVCGGIREGTYQISADLIYNNEVYLNSSIDVEIKQ